MGWLRQAKHLVLGDPIATAQASHERLTRPKALAVLSSDALSSVAYATEESLVTLSAAGVAAFAVNIPIALSIAALLWIVTISYRQTIFAYPNGGGAYTVAADNLGRNFGLTAAAALLIDYVLTVSVSVSSGVAALTSAVPALTSWNVVIGVGCIALITLINLRGIRDSANIFAVPTFLFVGAILAMLGIGAFRVLFQHQSIETMPPPPMAAGGLGIFLILKTFASGCSAMTGVEAISNGVPAFKAPESKHAAQTMLVMSALLTTMFLGITFLAHSFHLAPSESETILSQLARATIGSGWFYYVIQSATLLILVLAANTSFADFPRLASILATDGYMPRQFTFRGDRLAYSVGIVILAVFAAIVLVAFNGDVSALIPLYAIGVFISFTLSQIGMVVHWLRNRGRHWQLKLTVNGIGAIATAAVAVIAGVTKFASGDPIFTLSGVTIHAGSWIVLVLIPLQVYVFRSIHQHYSKIERDVVALLPTKPDKIRHRILVPVAQLWPVTLQSLAYALSITKEDVTALHVTEDKATAREFKNAWDHYADEHPYLRSVSLRIIDSPYRSLIGPLLEFIDETHRQTPGAVVSVILAEFVPEHWWEQLLHNQTALRLKAALLFRPGVVVISVPSHVVQGS